MRITPPSARDGGGRSSSAAVQLAGEIGEQVELLDRLRQDAERRPRAARPGERRQRLGHVGKPLERVAQRAELPWSGAARGGAAGQTLEVPHAVERLAQAGPAPAVARGDVHRVEPQPMPPARAGARAATGAAAGHPSASRWRPPSPAGCSPRAPARSGSTSSRFRRVISSSQSKASLRRTTGRARWGSPPAEARPGSGATRPPRRRAAHRRDRRPGRRVKRARTGGPAPRGRGRGRTPSARGGEEGARPSQDATAVSPGHHDLGRAQARDGLLDAIRAQRLEHKLAGAQVHRGHADPATPARQRRIQLLRRPGIHSVHQERAGRHRLHHLAADQSLRQPWVLHLLADGDPIAPRHQLPQILGRGLDRHTGSGTPSPREVRRDLQHPRRELGVLVEHLVEVADAIKEDGVRTLRLHFPPVLEHRRSRGAGGLAGHGRRRGLRGDWRDIRWTI